MTHTFHYVTRDGAPVTGQLHSREMLAVGQLLRHVPYSVDHAVRHEGYGIPSLTTDTADGVVWDDDTRRRLSAIARRLMSDHGHHADDVDPLTLENCGACVLGGYGAHAEESALMPNYAGWARVYVQAGRRIPADYVDGFLEELESDNRRYAACLARDVRTYGVDGITRTYNHATEYRLPLSVIRPTA